MIIISAVNAKLLVIRVELNHEMDDVESILLAWFWDMDAGEVSFMRETHLLVPLFPDLHMTTSNAEALESIIQNIHYVGVVFFLVVSGRVKIHGVGGLWVKNDKDGAPVNAGKRHLKLFPI